MKTNYSNTAVVYTIAFATLAIMLFSVGCHHTRTYDGALSPDYSRLTIDNRTPWPCAVSIIPNQTNADLSAIWANIESQRSLTWDLIPGQYKLTAVADEGAQFETQYTAPANSHRRWPLVNRQNPLLSN